MKIIIVSPSLDPKNNVSGISSVVKDIITHNSNYEYIHFQQGKKDKEFVCLRVFSFLASFFKWIYLLLCCKGVLIHYNFPLTTKAILRDSVFISVASFFRFKMVIHLHGGNYLFKKDPNKIVNRFLRYVFSLNYPFICLSEQEKEILVDKYNIEKVFVLPNAVNVCGLSDKIYPDSKHKLRILFLGRIAETKGIEFIKEAFDILKDKIDFTLLFAGEEENKNQYIPQFYQILGKDRFQYCGVVVGQEKMNLIQHSDIFLLPSFYEGLPMSLLETMSCGVVPVVTDVGAVRTCVREGETGFFIKTKDVKSIVDTILYLNDHREKLKSVAVNAKKEMSLHYSLDSYIIQLNKIYALC